MGQERTIEERRGGKAGVEDDRFRLLYEDNPCMYFTVDEAGTILSVNRFGAEQLGYSSAELVGAPVSDVVHPADRGRAAELLAQAFASPGEPRQWEFRKVRKDGGELWVRETVRLVERGSERVLLVVCEDITRHHELEAALRQAHKMEAIGRLAGSVAHDFNNLLTVVAGYAEMLLAAPELAPHLREPALEIQRASERGTALTRQLLAFGKKQPSQPVRLDPVEVLRGLEPLLLRLVGEHIELRFELEDCGHVLADQAQLEQVLMNLVLNARDAMPDGGTLTLSAAQREIGADAARRAGLASSGPHVLLGVRDTGCGMDEETRQRAFEPYFTTKGGRGTGLGLASVYGIVRQSGGGVTLESTPGRGATFTLHLPVLADGVPTRAGALPGRSATPSSASGTVLLVEDEPGVRGLLASTLQRAGYRVLAAGSGGEADRILAGHDGPLDLLLTDLVMPGESGRALARRLQATRPGLKVVYMSGYPGDALPAGSGADGELLLLSKPFGMAELARVVEGVLAG